MAAMVARGREAAGWAEAGCSRPAGLVKEARMRNSVVAKVAEGRH